jgi:hypothetical protein
MPKRPGTALVLVLVALVLTGPTSAHASPKNAGLQVALRAWGVYFGPVDGIAGPQTRRAVRTFQARRGLVVDGIAGRMTRRALGRLGRPDYGQRVMRRGMTGWDVSVLQFLLARRGAPTGIVDGHFGPRTAGAVRAFQRRSGLAADGLAGPATRHALARGVGVKSVRARAPARSVRGLLDYWAGRYGMSARFIRALAWIESGWQRHVVSSVGARGVMQVTPATRRFVQTVLLGHPVPRTTSGNIQVGVVFIRHLHRRFNGNVRLALAGYNQGEWSVRRNGVFRETRRFVANVLATRGRV